ncbi:MAG TPA: hypothetical protein VMT19_12555 [Thermoanaerobaculaceae bacterium]|nr:hypothetical protein [Thermoanaerobaculaceae bacterium]
MVDRPGPAQVRGTTNHRPRLSTHDPRSTNHEVEQWILTSET